MARIFSGIQPTGDLHLGNLLGALNNWVKNQEEQEAVYCVVDLHALTTQHDQLKQATVDITQMLLAVGIDPAKSILFAQSAVPEHAQMGWLLQCNVSFGELKRMTQFKDKSEQADFISAGLFTYPALQAADILLYDTEVVPVGDDQRQHIELTRDIAERFNSRYGETFVIPSHHIPETAARVMDLQNPNQKMSKSEESSGTIYILDDPKAVEKKIQRAVTDSENEVSYDVAKKPGVSNLLEIMSAISKTSPTKLAEKFKDYKELKQSCAEMVVSILEPIAGKYSDIASDPKAALEVLAAGAASAQQKAAEVLERARQNIGLL